MSTRDVVMRWLAVGVPVLLACEAALAQPVFQTARNYTVPGDQLGALGILLVADIARSDDPRTPDGVQDLISANQNLRAVVVLLGNPDGSFSVGDMSDAGGVPMALAVGDFDEDHVLDLVVSDDSGNLRFLKGNNDGTFTVGTDTVPAGRNGLAVIDLNNDKHLDVVAVDDGTDRSTATVKVLLGNGNGTFIERGDAIPTPAGTRALALGDFNGDTKTDVAIANAGASSVSILRGNGAGDFAIVQTIPIGITQHEPIAIATDDFNGDHRADLVIVSRNTDEIAILDGRADGSFAAPHFFPSGSSGSAPDGLAVADLNADNHPDVMVSNNLSSDASVLLGDGKGGLASPRAFVTDEQALAVVAHDFNGDGIPEVVTINKGGGNAPTAAVLIGQGDGSFQGVEDVTVLLQADATGLTVGDVDNDGVVDLISAFNSGDILVQRANPPAAFAAPLDLKAGGSPVSISRGDLNGDGRLDVVALIRDNQGVTTVVVFLARASGGFKAPQTYAVGSGGTVLSVGDWNRDGRADVAVGRQGSGPSGAVEVLVANSDGNLSPPMCSPQPVCPPLVVGMGPTAIDFGDFNNDGKPDLVVGTSQDISLLLGNGNGTFQTPTTVPTNSGGAAVSTSSITVADFDRDGFDDFAAAQPQATSVIVLYGDGHGGFTQLTSRLSVPGIASGLVARDVTGEGAPDLIVTDQVSNNLRVFEANPTQRRFSVNSVVPVSRQPMAAAVGDFDGDGRYDGAALATFVANVSVLTNIRAPAVVRGDGNGDRRVSAADVTAVIRELGDGSGTRIEQKRVAQGKYAAALGVDANGDGLITLQDTLAVAHRLFPRL